MNSRRWWNRFAQRAAAALLFAVPALFSSAGASAQTLSSPIGTSTAPQTVTVTITTAGVVNSIVVATQGSQALDFTLANGGSCTTGVPGTYLAGAMCTVQYVFTPTRPFTRYGAATLYDGSGNVLGNAFLTGVGTGAQVGYPLGPASVSTALGSGFMNPNGVAVDASGNVYVADTKNNAVKEIPAGGGAPITLGSGFSAPAAVAVDGAGNVYVADAGNAQVKEIVATNGSVAAATLPIVLASNTTFTNPQGIAVDGNGDVFVADLGRAAVYEIVAVNGVIPPTTLLSPNTPTVNTLPGSYTTPSGVAVDAAGDVFIADSANSGITEIPASTSSTVILGSGLTGPKGVAVDALGNVYAGSTGTVTEFLAVNGAVPTSGATAVVLGAGFTTPAGVAVDSAGNVYVADTASTSSVAELAETAPSLTFTASTAVGVQSTDSPMPFTIQNIGNAALNVPVPASGTNPSVSQSFTLAPGTCPIVSSTAGSLAAGARCTYGVNFVPATVGSPSGSLVLTDNNLGASNTATQSFNLSGTSTVGTPQVTVSSVSVAAGSSFVTLTAQVAFDGVPPTGQFTFTVGSFSSTVTCPGTTSPLSCSTTYDPSALAVGSYTIGGSIAADTNYTGNSGTAQLTVTQGTPSVNVTSSGSPSAVDSAVTFTATVTPGTGTAPTGSVSFTNSLNSGASSAIGGCTSLTLSGGKATCTTSALRAGSNAVTASIAADSNFNTASSTPLTQTVTAATPTLIITSSSPQQTSTVNQAVTLTATLTVNGQIPTVPATGTVRFTTGSPTGSAITGCDNAPVNTTTETATCTTTALVAPADSIFAVYTSADTNYNTANNANNGLTQNVKQATPVNAINSSQPSASINQSVTFTVMITPPNSSTNGVIPTGSVTFFNGTANLCQQAVVVTTGANGTGTASCTTTFTTLSTGTTISATYSGDQNFLAGNAPSVSQVVGMSATSIAMATITVNPSSPSVNGSTSLSATLTPAFSGSVTPSGTITFTDNFNGTSTPACTSTVSNGVVSPCTYSFSSAGTHTLTATYSGDTNFSPTSSTSGGILVVASGTVTIGITNSPTSVTVNQSATYTAAFSSIGKTPPSGTVQYYDGSPNPSNPAINAISGCQVTVTSSGAIPPCTEVLTSVGTHVIYAVYTSNSTSFSNITSSGFNETVTSNTTATTVTAPTASSSVDQQITFSATVKPTTLSPAATGTTAPTGTVTFSYTLGTAASVTLCTPTVSTSSSGIITASCVAALPTASATGYSITAIYNGDTNFQKSPVSPAITQVVNQTAISIGLVAGSTFSVPVSPAVNQATVLSVQLTLSNGATGPTTPGGSVTFIDSSNSAVTCTAPVTTSSQASCTLSEPTAGSHTIMASYSGDTNFSKNSAPFTFSVGKSTTAITQASISTNPSTPMVNQSNVYLSATLTSSNPGTALPTGTVLFYDTAPGATAPILACTAPISNGVVQPCLYVFTVAGTHSIQATYNGDTNFSSVSQTGSVTVGGVGTLALALTSPGSVVVNQQSTYTTTFTPAANGPTYPTGTVQYFDGTTAIAGCNVTVASNGTIPSCTEILLTAGQHNITATFTSSSTNFPNASANTLVQLVTLGTTQTKLVSPSTATSVDQPVTFRATLAPVSTGPGTTLPTGTITFYALNSNGVSNPACGAQVTTVGGVTSATCSVAFGTAGTYGIYATYGSDTNFQTSTSSPNYSEVVSLANVTVSLSGATLTTPASPVANQSATYSVTVTPQNATGPTLPTGSVTFTDTVTGLGCTATVGSTGGASCSFSTTGNGSHSIKAAYNGDTNFNPSSASFAVQITLASPILTITQPTTPPTINLTGFNFNATLTPPTGSTGVPTGTVTFTDTVSKAVLCITSLVAGSVPPCPYTFPTAGVHSVSASYSGDGSFGAVNATVLSILVSQAQPSISVTSTAPTSVANQPVLFTATITPAPAAINPSMGTPTGTISFSFPPNSVVSPCTTQYVTTSNGTEIGTCTVTFAPYTSGTGIYPVTVLYSGDSNYLNNSASITQNVRSFSAALTTGSVALGEGDSNNTDPYSTAPSISYSLNAQNGFSDSTTTTCGGGPTGLQCFVTPQTFSAGSSAVVTVTAASSVPAGVYSLTLLTTDNSNSSLQQNAALQVTVIGRVYPAGSTTPYSVPTSGQITIPFTLPTTLAGSTYTCNSNVANVGSNGTYSQTGDTLSSLGLTCTVTGSGTSYTVTVTTGSGGSTTASLQHGQGTANRNGLLAAGLCAPFLLLLGVRRDSRRQLRRAMARSLFLLLVTVTALYATGCSSGGFSRGTNPTYAVGGSYLIGINNASGATVTEVPLLVTGNGAGI